MRIISQTYEHIRYSSVDHPKDAKKITIDEMHHTSQYRKKFQLQIYATRKQLRMISPTYEHIKYLSVDHPKDAKNMTT